MKPSTLRQMFMAVVTLAFGAAVMMILVSFTLACTEAQTVPVDSRNSTNAEEQCAHNLKRIYTLLKLSLHHSGGIRFPRTIDSIYSMAEDPKPFICPSDKGITSVDKSPDTETSYEIVNDPLNPELSKVSSSRIAIVIEKRPNHQNQRLVLFYDGSIRRFSNEQYEALREKFFVDTEASGATR